MLLTIWILDNKSNKRVVFDWIKEYYLTKNKNAGISILDSLFVGVIELSKKRNGIV